MQIAEHIPSSHPIFDNWVSESLLVEVELQPKVNIGGVDIHWPEGFADIREGVVVACREDMQPGAMMYNRMGIDVRTNSYGELANRDRCIIPIRVGMKVGFMPTVIANNVDERNTGVEIDGKTYFTVKLDWCYYYFDDEGNVIPTPGWVLCKAIPVQPIYGSNLYVYHKHDFEENWVEVVGVPDYQTLYEFGYKVGDIACIDVYSDLPVAPGALMNAVRWNWVMVAHNQVAGVLKGGRKYRDIGKALKR